ncbi:helix-turn-helix transcriptional regulator [Mycolicibacterium chitae]|uniref:Response regulator receiver protein n=1 Tax=Mycolicibacterium chitae TaxID=1792 RepID=A0A3S4T4F0_MYCCI|nr:LuxR C-terminal-related transcriptional regulator [Mycolicibacterium chitae]MCV7105993.1 LuxR family transcriptional regulator [Mycolicibacterium chitae]BBZ01823.1 helix-turn-helix transcriptional regulator [Mycolicibacterium chitae]VEG50653.1 response regulator receiver protein [Mycolicibacterium chitae]
MSTGSAVLRPRDTDVLRAELRQLATRGGIPVLFGGEVHGDGLVLSEFVGTRTGLLRGVVVRPSSGLGGASMVAGRPLSVADYRNASTITHDYDVPVLSEGIGSVLAVPVVVDGVARAMLYGAYRSKAPIGGRAVDLMIDSGRRLADELRIRDEVDRRLRLREAHAASAVSPEVIREVYAELRRLAADAEPGMRNQLQRLAEQLAGDPRPEQVSLTPRERDVLAQVALGCTNAEAAERLSLRPETVKSYLRSAATKLGTGTRFESVSRARLRGLIP